MYGRILATISLQPIVTDLPLWPTSTTNPNPHINPNRDSTNPNPNVFRQSTQCKQSTIIVNQSNHIANAA